jgi:hypothetical protein
MLQAELHNTHTHTPFESVSPRPLSFPVDNIKNFDGPIRRTRRESLPVVIQLSIVLPSESSGQGVCAGGTNETHNHVIVGCFNGDWIGGRRERLCILTRQGWADFD